MTSERRNEGARLHRDDKDTNHSHSHDSNGSNGYYHDTPGDANPALVETLGFAEGTVTTADLLRARETAEATLPGAAQDRDKGLVGGPHFHEPPVLPIVGYDAEEDIYDREEMHSLDEEPEMHVFAPGMINISSGEKE